MKPAPQLIDTHCHLDADAFNHDRPDVIRRASGAGVAKILIPAVHRDNFEAVKRLAHAFDGGYYALGIHPMCVPHATEYDLETLDAQIRQCLTDPRFVAIGEVGLDFFVPGLRTPPMRDRQALFFTEQLRLAARYQLPVLLHVRRSQDELLKYLRRHSHAGGLAHAFNGSFQQAQQFIDQGFALGMGGSLTFSRALQIRRLATQLPLEHLVLETDAPDIPPAWLAKGSRNEPAEVAGVATTLAGLREIGLTELAEQTSQNAYRCLPRLA